MRFLKVSLMATLYTGLLAYFSCGMLCLQLHNLPIAHPLGMQNMNDRKQTETENSTFKFIVTQKG